jgi:hypothetical protein
MADDTLGLDLLRPASPEWADCDRGRFLYNFVPMQTMIILVIRLSPKVSNPPNIQSKLHTLLLREYTHALVKPHIHA